MYVRGALIRWLTCGLRPIRLSLSQGVALDTSMLQVDQRLLQYSYGQPQTGGHTHTLHLQNMQNLQKSHNFNVQLKQNPSGYGPADMQTGVPAEQQDSQDLSTELDFYNVSQSEDSRV